MQKITTPLPEDRNAQRFSEGINYFHTPVNSIWGEGDPDTLRFLNTQVSGGSWLHLAAGDGRYNNVLLSKLDELVATDIDPSALSKLYHGTSDNLKSKLKTAILDITKPFPFKASKFDGALCFGTLHLFKWPTLEHIFMEIHKILKQNGRLIFDFATDIKRVAASGDEMKRDWGTHYTYEEAEALLHTLLSHYNCKFHLYEVLPETVTIAQSSYTFSCKYWLIDGVKK